MLRELISRVDKIDIEWEQFIGPRERDLQRDGKNEFVADIRKRYGVEIKKITQKIKELIDPSLKKSMFSRFNPFSKKGGKKRSRKTKKRRR
jgi:hypothetical protein